jgi:hypothetical protein
MTTTDTANDLAFCEARLRIAQTIITDAKAGIRWSRGTLAAGMRDITDRHVKQAQDDVAYWSQRLAALGPR